MTDKDVLSAERLSKFSNAARPTAQKPLEMAAQDQAEELEGATVQIFETPRQDIFETPSPADAIFTPSTEEVPDLAKPAAVSTPKLPKKVAPALGKIANAGLKGLKRGGQALRYHRLKKSYLTALTHLHRRILDASTEKLLFVKTQALRDAATPASPEAQSKRPSFAYQGPMPRLVLQWLFSALPADLKRYAFIDFHAGNGRTLLLAARYNFEHTQGYCFDEEAYHHLQMNIAQYPRPYLSCRDLRAIRGDQQGLVIPDQPAVLFFPDHMRSLDVEIILSHISSSYSLDPRPIYLIFENKPADVSPEQLDIFKKKALPVSNALKTLLFSPGKIGLYGTKECEER